MWKSVLLLTLIAAAPAYATDYFVRSDGNDSRCTGLTNAADTGSGTSGQACAWATVDKCSSTLVAGDRCRVQPGTYFISKASMTSPVNNGSLKGTAVGTGCSCTAGSTTVTCSNAGTVAVGDWVRCQSSDPYFDWTRVSAKNGNTLTLEEGYRGVTVASGSLDAAKFVEYIGDGPADSVILTHLQAKPSGVTWTASTNYAGVYSYPKSSGTGNWAAPLGFSAQGTPGWDKWFANRDGKDTFIKLNVTGSDADRCPCAASTGSNQVTTCEAHVTYVPGSWCDDGTKIWVHTWDGSSPTAVDVQASNIGLGAINWNVAGKDYIAFRNLYFKIHPANNGGTASAGNSTASSPALRMGGNKMLVSGVTAEGGSCQFDFTGGKSQQQFEHLKCLDKATAIDADVALSGTRFFDMEVRGGYSNGWSMNYVRGASSTDRVIFDRIYLHRVFTWYRTNECANNAVYDCSAKGFPSTVAQAGAHGFYFGSTASDFKLDHFLIQNSIIEVTGDGMGLFNNTGTDITVRNCTFGASHSTYANWRQEVLEWGMSGMTGGINVYNNVFYVDSTTGANVNGAIISYDASPTWTGYRGNNNMFLEPYNGGYNMATYTELIKGTGSLPDYSPESMATTYGQDTNSVVVCASGCSSTKLTRVYNEGSTAANYFVKPYVTDGKASNYTPTASNKGVNAGLNSQCPPYDFYGNPRSDGACDIGAVELQSGGSDTTPPAAVTNFAATPGQAQITLGWNHSASSDNKGTMVRFKTSGYPTSATDGSLVCDKVGNPGAADSCVHSGLTNGTTYYYTAFSYDAIPNYGAGAQASAAPNAAPNTPPSTPQNLIRTDKH